MKKRLTYQKMTAYATFLIGAIIASACNGGAANGPGGVGGEGNTPPPGVGADIPDDATPIDYPPPPVDGVGGGDDCGVLLCDSLQWWNSNITYQYKSHAWHDTDLHVPADTEIVLRHASRLEHEAVYAWGWMPEFTDTVTGERFRFLHLRPSARYTTSVGTIYGAGTVVGLSGGDTPDTGHPACCASKPRCSSCFSTAAHLCVQTTDPFETVFPTGEDGCAAMCPAQTADHPTTASLTAPSAGDSVTGGVHVVGTVFDSDGLAKVTLTLDSHEVPICNANCPGTMEAISTIVDPAQFGYASGAQITFAVWAKDLLGNKQGPLAARSVTWHAQSGSSSSSSSGSTGYCGDGTCSGTETCANCQADCGCGNGTVCGTSGQCTPCGSLGQPCCLSNSCSGSNQCLNGTCGTCTPSCSGKCGGAADGCGGLCSAACPSSQQCVNQACVGCNYATTLTGVDYTSPSGQEPICIVQGPINGAGQVTITAKKCDNTTFGAGDYYVLVFDPNDGNSASHCQGINTQKAHVAVSGTPMQIQFPAFDSLLTCGGAQKAYCVTKAGNGNVAWFGSANELRASYQ